jgi:hypothetical protein
MAVGKKFSPAHHKASIKWESQKILPSKTCPDSRILKPPRTKAKWGTRKKT